MKIALKAAAAGLMFVAFAAEAEEFKAGEHNHRACLGKALGGHNQDERRLYDA